MRVIHLFLGERAVASIRSPPNVVERFPSLNLILSQDKECVLNSEPDHLRDGPSQYIVPPCPRLAPQNKQPSSYEDGSPEDRQPLILSDPYLGRTCSEIFNNSDF